jgi:exodeoxyribonuclease VIII
MKHIVIDIETFSTQPNAMIASIAAVVVDGETLTISEDHFDAAIDFNSMGHADYSEFHFDPNTILWWLRQPQRAREALQYGNDPLWDALHLLGKFIERHAAGGDFRVWGNGPGFDMEILKHAYKTCFVPVPWPFWSERCIRTTCEDHGVDWKKYRESGAEHDALADATAEAKGLIECLKAKAPPTTVVFQYATPPEAAEALTSQTTADRERDSLGLTNLDGKHDTSVDWAKMAEGAVPEEKRGVYDAHATARAALIELVDATVSGARKNAISQVDDLLAGFLPAES